MKILLADDEPDILLLYRQMLEGNGYQVVEAKDGNEVLERVEAQDYDLLVLDLHMPGRTGFEALAEMRRRGQKAPVIVMTGYYPDAEVKEGVVGLGVEETLRKPVMITTLINAVNRVVARVDGS